MKKKLLNIKWPTLGEGKGKVEIGKAAEIIRVAGGDGFVLNPRELHTFPTVSVAGSRYTLVEPVRELLRIKAAKKRLAQLQQKSSHA